MKTIKSNERFSIVSSVVLVCLAVFAGWVDVGNTVAEVSDSIYHQQTQEIPPEANAGEDIITFVSNETVFRGYGSSLDSEIVRYEWDFDGDGHYDWESAESGLSSHKYNVPGDYNVLFRVTDSLGNFTIDSIKVQVNPGNGKLQYLKKKEKQDFLADQKFKASVASQAAVAGGDGVVQRYAVMINGANETRFWDDVTFMYSTLIDDYQFTPESIYLFNYNGSAASGGNPNNMIDYPASKDVVDSTFTQLSSLIDSDDELFVWITGHGRGYNGMGSEYYGYMDGSASVDPGDEEDYLESDFKLRSLYTGGNYKSDHGMDVWKVFYSYYSSGNYRMWRHKYVSHFNGIYFENTGNAENDNDIFIERLNDYLEGDYNRNGIIEINIGEVYDYDGDGVSPYNPVTGFFDEDDWGRIDYYDDDVTRVNTQVPGSSYIIFDANLDNHLDIDIDYDINNLKVDGTDLDNQGLFDGIDVNSDGDMNDWVSIDELIQIYGDKLSDDDMALFVNRVNAKVISIFAQQCFSGGLVEDLSSPNRVISTASSEEALSYGNLFVKNFTSAFHWADTFGVQVNADYDGNGFVSMQEAFNYAALNDYYNETPQYDDNGDGISHSYPIPYGGDGDLGASVYLEVDNSDPIADAGPDINITSAEIATTIIHGSATDTDLNDLLLCAWEDENLQQLTPLISVGPNGECPLNLSTLSLGKGIYTMTLVAFDGIVAVEDDMILTVSNIDPVADAGPDINITSADISTTVIQGTVTDMNSGDMILCAWEDENLQQLTPLMSVGPNGECPLDLSTLSLGKGVFTLTLYGIHGTVIVNNKMILTVSNVNPVADAGPDINITSADISTTVIQGTVTDADPGDMILCAWEDENLQQLTPLMSVGQNGECPLDLSVHSFNPGTYILTLYGLDGIAVVENSMVLSIF